MLPCYGVHILPVFPENNGAMCLTIETENHVCNFKRSLRKPNKSVGKCDIPEKQLALKISIALSVFANKKNRVAK